MYHVLNFLEIAKKGRAKGIFFAQQKRVDLDILNIYHLYIINRWHKPPPPFEHTAPLTYTLCPKPRRSKFEATIFNQEWLLYCMYLVPLSPYNGQINIFVACFVLLIFWFSLLKNHSCWKVEWTFTIIIPLKRII